VVGVVVGRVTIVREAEIKLKGVALQVIFSWRQGQSLARRAADRSSGGDRGRAAGAWDAASPRFAPTGSAEAIDGRTD
jgi:hypothetical protein